MVNGLKKRAVARMVDEDNPQWLRFWDAYPYRRAKKEARVAWASLDPTPEQVEQMLRALEWQTRDWAAKASWYTPPYPASWLRAERWEDEPPMGVQKKRWCEHEPACHTQQEHTRKMLNEQRAQRGVEPL